MKIEITKIEKQKNNDKRYSVFINDEFSFGIDEVDLLYYKIQQNSILTEEKYQYIMENLVLKKAKDKALKYLSYKMRAKSEVIKKLQQLDFTQDVIDKVLQFLENYNYVNDDDFAKCYIKDKINVKGYGSLKISYQLKLLGIHEDIYEKYLYDEHFVNELDKIKTLIYKKMKNIDLNNIDYKEKQKLFNYLARRGFSYDNIKSSFSELLEE